MAKVDSAIQIESFAALVKLPGKYDGFLTLSAFPPGDGDALNIGGYRFPYLNEFVIPSTPGDFRPRVAIGTTELDLPIELLIGEEVTWA